jgi:hypothetical protein
MKLCSTLNFTSIKPAVLTPQGSLRRRSRGRRKRRCGGGGHSRGRRSRVTRSRERLSPQPALYPRRDTRSQLSELEPRKRRDWVSVSRLLTSTPEVALKEPRTEDAGLVNRLRREMLGKQRRNIPTEQETLDNSEDTIGGTGVSRLRRSVSRRSGTSGTQSSGLTGQETQSLRQALTQGDNQTVNTILDSIEARLRSDTEKTSMYSSCQH